jgi:hypothetical protein
MGKPILKALGLRIRVLIKGIRHSIKYRKRPQIFCATSPSIEHFFIHTYNVASTSFCKRKRVGFVRCLLWIVSLLKFCNSDTMCGSAKTSVSCPIVHKADLAFDYSCRPYLAVAVVMVRLASGVALHERRSLLFSLVMFLPLVLFLRLPLLSPQLLPRRPGCRYSC